MGTRRALGLLIGFALVAAAFTAPPATGVGSAPAAAPMAMASDGVATGAPHRAYVAVVTDRGALQAPYTSDSAINAMVDGVLDYWKTESAGAITSFSRVGAIKRFEPSTPGCDINTLISDGADQFPSANTGSTVDHIVVLAPLDPECTVGAEGFAPLGSGFGSPGISISYLDDWAESTLAHELGHTFGFSHANVVKCPAGVCGSPGEYADPYGVMAGGQPVPTPALGSLYRRLNGVQAVGEALDVALDTGQTSLDSNHNLAPLTASTGLRSLTITDPVDGEMYFVEYRSGTGRDAGTLYTVPTPPEAIFPDNTVPGPGVVVTRCNDRSSELMVRSESNYYRGEYVAGQSFTSPSGGLTVAVTAVSTSLGADVSVSLDGPAPTAGTPYTPPTPEISGIPNVGQRLVAYTALPPTWNRTYRWTANGVTIAGSAQGALVVTPALLGKALRVEVTGHQCGQPDATSTSPARTVVPGTFTAPVPKITGTAKVGKTLKAVPGTWSPVTPAFSYQWYVGTKAVKGATGRKFKLKASAAGKKVYVKVTGKRTGYQTLTKTSKKTGKVKK